MQTTRRRTRVAAGATAGLLALLALAVWPVPSLWQDGRVANSWLLVRDAGDLDLSLDGAAVRDGTAAATVLLAWDEPVRLRDRCVRDAVVTLSDGWRLAEVFGAPGHRVVSEVGRDGPALLELEPGAERFVRATFVLPTATLQEFEGGSAEALPSARVSVQRVCPDGAGAVLDDVRVDGRFDLAPDR